MDLEALIHPLEKTRLEAAPEVTKAPWLTARQNEQRRELHARLAEWLERVDVDSERKAEVNEAVRLVSRIEEGLSRAEQLLQEMHSRLLTESEWSELTFLVEQARANTQSRVGNATDRLDGLVKRGALRSAEADSLKASLQRLVAAHEFLSARELPWRGIVTRVEVPPGEGSAPAALAESRVVPGTAFGRSFARGYSFDANAGWFERALDAHVPCLAQTTLTGARGQMLFRGLHRGFIGLPLVDPTAIMALPFPDLSRLVSATGLARHWSVSLETYLARVEQCCLKIRYQRGAAYRAGSIIKDRAGAAMVMESAAAALCSNPAQLQRALGGEAAEIKLFDVSLLTGSDFLPWRHHYDEQRGWESRQQVSLNLCGPDREPHRISANATVRLFALSLEDQWYDFRGYSGLDQCVVRLLGEMDSRKLGGDALARVEGLRARVRDLGGELAAAGHERARSLPPGALEHPGGLPAGNHVIALQAETSRLDRQARALEQAAQQLKDMWRIPAEWPTGADAYGAAARLALVAYLMGETPVLSCASGTDYSRRLDAEVKILATVTDCRGGHVPPADLDMAAWDAARTVLTKE